MTDRRNEGGGLSRCRDAGIAEASLKLGPEAATAHPGVLTECDGAWVHHVCDGKTVEVWDVSGAELEALRERIGLFQVPFSMAGFGPGDGAPKGLAHDASCEAAARDLDRVAEELMSERPDLDAVELQLRGDALAGSAALYQARLEAVDAALPAPKCPRCVFLVDANPTQQLSLSVVRPRPRAGRALSRKQNGACDRGSEGVICRQVRAVEVEVAMAYLVTHTLAWPEP